MIVLMEPSSSSMNGITSPTFKLNVRILYHVINSSHLNLNKLSPTLDGDLDERVAGHILDAFVGLVHELEQLVHHCLQEPPVGPEESGVLAHDVHDV